MAQETIGLSLPCELIIQARECGIVQGRSVAQQIEHWVMLGKIAEQNPSLSFASVERISTQTLSRTEQAPSPLELAASFTAPRIGQYVPCEGIFMGLWQPRDKAGNLVGIECELYADTRDQRFTAYELKTCTNKMAENTCLTDPSSYDSGLFSDDGATADFLRTTADDFIRNGGRAGEDGWFRPNCIGNWFVPAREIVDGMALDKNGRLVKVRTENLYDLRDVGSFAGTFTTTSANDYAEWYWSSTKHRTPRDDSDSICIIDFSRGICGWGSAGNTRLSCRLCRVGRVRHLTL